MIFAGKKENGMDNIQNEKKIIRQQIRKLRDAMPKEEMFAKSSLIFEQLITLPEYKRAGRIYTYVSMKNEVDTIMLIDYSLSMEKRVFVPRVCGNTKDAGMEFYEISDISELSPGYMGIFEPDINGKEPDEARSGFLCMPGMAFDREYHRIGYGGGFFDRYLSRENKLCKAALAYDFQVLDRVPAEECDIRPDMIITENEVFRHLDY